ncbi:lamin tail domain-containing protein [Flavobacterium sp. MAH-1]|uniref:Lamin tail domain-containing protein n=1 Tax=Flavobacterium agri TaxID=2743471 RepID=A0A7Y8Y4U0_9FLAO|nr:lamin tail domain-containing protein [Flavobacterium agri]NUY82361.1 lamin tail domain-containing protein [Flavobacterium agri]NYA72385.1 lamin tail domain-containing protein [Flavobacterium agri]
MNPILRKSMLGTMTAFLAMVSANLRAQAPNAPTALDASPVGATTFTANWSAVPGATSYKLDVSTSPTFSVPSTPTDLIISEYVEGSSGYKAIEIYNGTGAGVNIAAYSLRRGINGPLSTVAPTGTILPNNSTWVIAYAPGIAPDLQAVANQTTSFGMMNLDGNTAIYLRKTIPNSGGVIELVDSFGVSGEAIPWGVDVTLRRKASVIQPTLNYVTGDADVYATNDISGLGSHTMNNFAPSFVPGYEDLTVNGTSQVVSGLTAETDYYYRVRAFDANGTSINSNVIHVKTLPTINYVTQVMAAQCGGELASINSYIAATQLPNITGYRFEVTDTETSAVQTIDRTQNYFSMRMLDSYQYSKTYSVRVMVQYSGVWVGYYGPTCTVSTPEVLGPGKAATINPSQCGGVLPTIATLISTTSLPAVTGYRFRVTNLSDPSAPNQVQIIDRGHLHWFSLTMLPRFNYGTTYSVEVAIRTTDDYSPYSNACEVTAPAVPSLVDCGGSVENGSSFVSVASKDRVDMYRFTIRNVETDETSVIDNELNWFRFNNLPNYVPGALYEVEVSVMVSGYYSLPGIACQITAPGAARQAFEKNALENDFAEAAGFEATAYPNPFSDSFGINVSTQAGSGFDIKVYDMTGRLIEDRKISADAIQTFTFGEKYPTGVYSVILNQANNVKVLRVVKR